MIVDTDYEITAEVFCRKQRCRAFLGQIVEDAQAIRIGNVAIFTVATLICKCGKPYRFEPKNLKDDLLTTDLLEQEYGF